MRKADLPTPAEVLSRADFELGVAYKALGDAGDELRSDTRELWTAAQVAKRRAMFEAIQAAKDAINEARAT